MFVKLALCLLLVFSVCEGASQEYRVLFYVDMTLQGGGEAEVTGFSPLVTAVHDDGFSFFQSGEMASSAMLTFATSDGAAAVSTLVDDARGSGATVLTHTALDSTPGSSQTTITASDLQPQVSFTAHIRGSPDFFIGGNGINLKNSDGSWAARRSVTLNAYDAGKCMSAASPCEEYPVLAPGETEDPDVSYGVQTIQLSQAGMFALELGVRPVGKMEFYRADTGPTIEGVAPAQISENGGRVVLSGYGFGVPGTTRSIMINGASCPIEVLDGVESAGPFQVVCTAAPSPSGTSSTVEITVAGETGTSSESISFVDDSVINPPAAPSSAPALAASTLLLLLPLAAAVL